MEKNFIGHSVSIPVYVKADNGFQSENGEVYNITYLKGNKSCIFEVVVNSIPSGVSIPVESARFPFKNSILLAISKYRNDKLANIPATKKGLTMEGIKATHNKSVVNTIKNHILSIKKEVTRDILTKFELI